LNKIETIFAEELFNDQGFKKILDTKADIINDFIEMLEPIGVDQRLIEGFITKIQKIDKKQFAYQINKAIAINEDIYIEV